MLYWDGRAWCAPIAPAIPSAPRKIHGSLTAVYVACAVLVAAIITVGAFVAFVIVVNARSMDQQQMSPLPSIRSPFSTTTTGP
jgi:hypothetical protein